MRAMYKKGEPYLYPEEVEDEDGNLVKTGKMLEADPIIIKKELSSLSRYRAAWKCTGVSCFA